MTNFIISLPNLFVPSPKARNNGQDEVLFSEMSLQDGERKSRFKNRDIVQAFRELVGPLDPVLGKKLRPNSLRAKFGDNKVLNSVHCTDLPEDGILEVEYCFKIMRV